MQFFKTSDSKRTSSITVLSYSAALERLIYRLSRDYWPLEVVNTDQDIALFTAQTDSAFWQDKTGCYSE